MGVVKYLGIDVGTKNVGLSISDDDGILAFPLDIISADNCISQIDSIAKEREIEVIVIGDANLLFGKGNNISTFSKKIGIALEELGHKVVFEPELFTTKQAERLGKGSDSEAAALILQSYLDRK